MKTLSTKVKLTAVLIVLVVLLVPIGAQAAPVSPQEPGTGGLEVLSVLAQQFMLAALPFIAVPLAIWMIAKARLAWAEFKDRQPDVAYYLENFARMAVLAAEKAKLPEWAAGKRDYAFAIVEKLLAAKGLTVDIDVIYAAIEAAVYDELNRDKTPTLKVAK